MIIYYYHKNIRLYIIKFIPPSLFPFPHSPPIAQPITSSVVGGRNPRNKIETKFQNHTISKVSKLVKLEQSINKDTHYANQEIIRHK